MAKPHKKPRARYDEGVKTDAEQRHDDSLAAMRVGRTGEGSVGGVHPFAITPDKEKVLLDAIRAGLAFYAACNKAGITYSTFCDWMIRGGDAKTDNRLKPAEGQADAIYAQFVARVRAAEADAEEAATAAVTSAFERDWRAGAWWLSKRSKADYGDNQAAVAVEATGTVSIVLPDNGRDRTLSPNQE